MEVLAEVVLGVMDEDAVSDTLVVDVVIVDEHGVSVLIWTGVKVAVVDVDVGVDGDVVVELSHGGVFVIVAGTSVVVLDDGVETGTLERNLDGTVRCEDYDNLLYSDCL